MTKRLGGTVGGIVLWPLGGVALCGPTEALSGDLKVALAGPLMHVPMGLLWWVSIILDIVYWIEVLRSVFGLKC